MGDVTALSIDGLRARMAAGELDAGSVVAASRDRARSVGASLNAFTEVTEAPSFGSGPLGGVPVAVKDVFVDGGRNPTMGSLIHASGLKGTATAIRRLRRAGAAVIGYTNLHEWGVGTTSTITATGPVRNPWAPERIAGGSSGGSAAAVAAGIVPVAIGTDAGGSVRIPAACCGVVGLKPTFGALPLDGDVAGTSPVNHAGVIARSVGDAASVYEVLAESRLAEVETDRLVIGVPDDFFYDDLSGPVAVVAEDTARMLGRTLNGLRPVAIPGIERSAQAVSESLLPHMAELLASQLEKRPEDFHPRTLKALQRGRAMALGFVDLAPFRASWERAFESCDVMVVPTLPALPPRIDEHKVELPSGPVVADLAQYALNAPMNAGGVPALAVPCADVDGNSISVTLVAQRGADDVLVAAGRALESALDGAYRDRVAPGPDA